MAKRGFQTEESGRASGSPAFREEIVRRTLLFDFYGELLTEHQREVYDAVILQDLGYSEAAGDFGVSRQGIHDLVKRSTKQLTEYESKLHLVERFLKIRNEVTEIRALSGKDHFSPGDARAVTEICDRILGEL
jgi:predicted DNA-binding protein YlxM (UPF0122 family)